MDELKTRGAIVPPQRRSVIQLNPTFSQREEEDSEDEFINVDEPDEMETEAISQAQRLAHELRNQNSPTKLTPSTVTSTTGEVSDGPPAQTSTLETPTQPTSSHRRRASPKGRFEPYPIRPEVTDENENRMCNKNRALQSVVEEIKKAAARTAQKPAHHQSQPYLTNQVGKLVLSSKPNGESAPNAVIRLNKNNNRNTEDIGISFASEESQNRPFKCHPCNIAFRISGHLSRHMKSRGHLLKVSQDELLNNRVKPESAVQLEQEKPIDLSLNSKKTDFTSSNRSPLEKNDIRPRVTPPKPEIKLVPTPRVVKLVTPSSTPTQAPPTQPTKEPKPEQEAAKAVVEITENGSRRFRCSICDIGFRFQGHLDRHMRSTTHMSMEEAVKRTGRRTKV